MSVSSVNNNNQSKQQYKHPGLAACVGGFIAGGLTLSGISHIHSKEIHPQIIQKMARSAALSTDKFISAEEGIEKTLINSGLRKKDVKITFLSPNHIDQIKEKATKEIQDLGEKPKGFLKGIKFRLRESKIKKGLKKSITICQGENALFNFKSNTILSSKKGLLFTFHEIGHAANAHFNTLSKALVKSRSLSALVTPITLIALLKTKKAPDEEPKNIIDRGTNFVKKNATFLTFLSLVPILAEEALATIRGNKYAKQVLDPALVKKYNKTQAIAYLTYLSSAIAVTASVHLGGKVKDALASSKSVEQKA